MYNTPMNYTQVLIPLSPYTLKVEAQREFDRLWLEEIQYFKEVPWHNVARANKAKEFAARVYALAIEKQKQENI
jgi:hypothetical protein